MPTLLRTVKDEPPALVPFLTGLTWRYGKYRITATWNQSSRRWTLKVGVETVDTFTTITAINAWLRDVGDDLRAGTFTVEGYLDRHAVVTFEEDDGTGDELARLRLPPPA